MGTKEETAMDLELILILSTAAVVGVGFGIYAPARWIGAATIVVLISAILMQLGVGKAWAGYGHFSIAFFVFASIPTVTCAWLGWAVRLATKEIAEYRKNS